MDPIQMIWTHRKQNLRFLTVFCLPVPQFGSETHGYKNNVGHNVEPQTEEEE